MYRRFSLSSCSHFLPRKYYHVNLELTWADAQLYCREKYTDLATIEINDDVSSLRPVLPNGWIWIGMSDDPKSWKDSMGNDSNSWRWSATGETSKTGYQNWARGEPSETKQTEKTYVFILMKKTWSNARDYCREHYTDLAMIENDKENTEVYSEKPGNITAWIGLYRVRWTWSDKSQSSFKSWRQGSPNNYGGSQYCMTVNSLIQWDDDTCSERLTFICHQAVKLKTTLRMEIKTDADITDPATNTQILQKLAAVLKDQGWTDFKLGWKIPPRKQEKRTEP
ncbi:macrophage mannose receptor 1-like [Cebidichthys violaceus]|uniref:macrophage mannose receptor 1-like n=1 Tax=Cebidichthys violaceus TaxID=271503 RepID=UPI0035CBE632